jgi:hypothetical protein
MKKVLIILFTIAASYGITQAQKPAVVVSDAKGWHKIGTLTADFQRETDEIAVFMADRFASLKFKVEGASINLTSLKVFYEDGTVEDVTMNLPFAIQAPGESKVIDLKGRESELKKVSFTYSSLNNAKDKKAKVELWGMKTNAIEGDKTKDKKTSDVYKEDKKSK